MYDEEDNMNEIGNENRAVKKSDKLDYRVVLQMKVDRCLSNINIADAFPRCVSALRAGMYFNIPGLPFRSKIQAAEKELKAKLLEEILPAIEDPNIWYHPYKRNLAVADPFNRYDYYLMEFLIDLLAKHDALIAAKDAVETGDE